MMSWRGHYLVEHGGPAKVCAVAQVAVDVLSIKGSKKGSEKGSKKGQEKIEKGSRERVKQSQKRGRKW